MSNANNADNKQFFSKILNSIGAGVVIALVPNALLGEVLKIFKSGNEILELTYQLVILIQSFMAFIIGVLAAHQFKFNGAGAAIVGTSAMMVNRSFSNVHERPKTLLYQGFCHF